MSDYKEQVNSLREHADLIETSIELYGPSATRLLVYDLRNAAAAIEDLQAELEKKRTADCFGCKCEKVEPKRGKWVEENRRPRSSQFVCSECHRTAYDPQPTRDKAWRKRCRYAYCPNCGAKMEVQE